MRPKEYYEQNTIQEDPLFVFTLLSSEFKGQYRKFIKEPIERISLDEGRIICSCFLEFEPGVDQLDEIWKSIQKASIIVANITDFKPDVMFELGVAMMKKGKVILIAEKNIDGKANLPFDISKLNVEFYDPAKLNELSSWLVAQVEKWVTPDGPKIRNIQVMKIMNDVLGLRRERKFDAALFLFVHMDNMEPANWYIYKEWGITFKLNKDYDNACKKLQSALEFTKGNSQKSEIYTELGAVFLENDMVNQAQIAFEKAENLDRDNAELYEKWASLYYTMGKFHDAMTKMTIALKLDENNEKYRWKFEFYLKKFADKNFTMELREWIDVKRIEKQSRGRGNKVDLFYQKKYQKKEEERNLKEDYFKFKKRYRLQEELYGKIDKIHPRIGIFVKLDFNITGLIGARSLPKNFDANSIFEEGKQIKVRYIYFNDEKQQISLLMAN